MNPLMTRLLATLLLALLSLTAQGVEVVTYYHNDALGSPIIATDQEGRVVWRKSYAPYGQPIGSAAPSEPGYTGKFEEPDLGIQYFGARWYDPRIGRFLAIDPVGFDPQNAQSFNRYAYANNNPYGFVDPDGRAPKLLYQWNFDPGIAGGSFGGYGRNSRARAPPRATSEGAAEAGGGNRGTVPSSEVARGGPVIGRMDDLTTPGALKPGEYTLLNRLPNLGNPKANYYQNMSVLREEMRKGVPIRDASAYKPDSFPAPTELNPSRTIRQTFTGAERNQLMNKGRTFDGEYWNPPER